jgi:hypothetical protein
MRSFTRSKLTLTVIALVMVIALSIPLAVLTIGLGAAHAAAQTHNSRAVSSPKNNNPLCSKLGKSVQASQGA